LRISSTLLETEKTMIGDGASLCLPKRLLKE
jgi:hypothetical protein